MKINKHILIYVVIVVLSYFIFYDFFDKTTYQTPQKDILQLDTHLWEDNKIYAVDDSYNYLWLKESKKNIVDKKTNIKEQSKSDIYKKNKNTICSNDICFRFLAIVKKNGISYASFYSKVFPNNHIKLFAPNEKLYNNLFIKSILNNTLVLSEYNTTNQWEFLFFDVNANKYKPKDIDETHL